MGSAFTVLFVEIPWLIAAYNMGMKRYQSVCAIYRNRVPDFDDRLMLTAAGLWNFYLEAA